MTIIDITRRHMLGGLAATLPSVAIGAEFKSPNLGHLNVAEPECIHAKVRRLTDELSEALNDYQGARWFATIYPSKVYDYNVMLGVIDAHKSPQTRLSINIANAKRALFEITGKWPFDYSRTEGADPLVVLVTLPDRCAEGNILAGNNNSIGGAS